MAYKVVTVSNGVYADVARWSIGLKRKLIVIFNPINPPSQQLLDKVQPKKDQQIVWVGRLDSRKNPMLALEAFALLPKDSGYRFIFVGDGPLRSSLELRCKELNLLGRVTFLGYQAKPYEVMAVSDLLVLSSPSEGLPSVLVEALFCGIRIVATDCGEGIHDILLENRYGIIVPADNAVCLAAAIEDALKKPFDKGVQMKGAQRFLPEIIARQFLTVMDFKTK